MLANPGAGIESPELVFPDSMLRDEPEVGTIAVPSILGWLGLRGPDGCPAVRFIVHLGPVVWKASGVNPGGPIFWRTCLQVFLFCGLLVGVSAVLKLRWKGGCGLPGRAVIEVNVSEGQECILGIQISPTLAIALAVMMQELIELHDQLVAFQLRGMCFRDCRT